MPGDRPRRLRSPSATASTSCWHASWRDEAIDELGGCETGNSEAKEYAALIIGLCSQLGTPQPTVDVDDEGNIELYLKRDRVGILMVVEAEGSLQIFGNENGERWRGKFSLAGDAWRRQFASVVGAFSNVVG